MMMTPSVQLLLPLLLAAVAAEAFLLAPPPASTHLLRPARAGAGAGAAPTNLLLSAPSCSRRVVAPLGAGADGEDSSAPKPRRTRKRRKEGVDVANMFSTEEDQQAWEGRGPSSQELSSKGVNMEALEADIAKYRRQKSQSTEVAKPDDEGGRLGIKEVISWIVTVDFFVVIAFLVWFVVGVGSSYGLHNSFLLDKFNELFPTLVQPAIGVLMAGTLAGPVLNKLENRDSD